jgi:hypothetical protein
MKMTPQPEFYLTFVDDTFAECVGKDIRIHKDLPMENLQLYQWVLEHEKGHLNKNIVQDFIHDFKDLFAIKMQISSTLFLLRRRPILYKYLVPFSYNKSTKTLEVNYVLIALYLLYFIATILIIEFLSNWVMSLFII